MDPPCILSTIAEIQKGQGLGSGYEWLAGLVSRVCIAGLVFRERDRRCMTSVNRLVVNLSSKSLSDQQQRVLAKGLKFAPTPKSIPVKEIVTNLESGLRRVPQQAADEARVRIVNLLKRARPPPSNIAREEENAIRTLIEE